MSNSTQSPWSWPSILRLSMQPPTSPDFHHKAVALWSENHNAVFIHWVYTVYTVYTLGRGLAKVP